MCTNNEFYQWKKCSDVFVTNLIKINDKDGKEVTIFDNNGQIKFEYNGSMPFSIFKCMPFERSELCLSNKKQYLTFASPNEWLDPFEYYFYDENLIDDGCLFCFCSSFTRAEHEEAMWKVYTNDNAKLHNIWALDFVKLLDALTNIAKVGGARFYITLIDYSLTKNNLRKVKSQITSGNIFSMINALSMKRKAFKYEDEIRIFAHVTDKKRLNENRAFQRIYLNLSGNNAILQKALMQPLTPRKKGFLSPEEYEFLQKKQNEKMENFYKSINVRAEQSRLYMIK